jgi:phage regulator Rha-like protein
MSINGNNSIPLVSSQIIERRIFILRGSKIMLDSDLAELYGVENKVLIQAVKRNISRFPSDFMFQLDKEEVESLRSQFVTSKIGRGGRRYLPYAFTEHGVAMLSSVLRSTQAIEINISIIRAFIRIREILASDKELAGKILEIEHEQKLQNKHINSIYSILDKLIQEPVMEPVTFADPIGFTRDS